MCFVSKKLFSGIASIEPHLCTASGNDSSSTSLISDMASEILSRLPPLFDLAVVEEKHPLSYSNSMNTVLRQASFFFIFL